MALPPKNGSSVLTEDNRGEDGVGKWTVVIKDAVSNEHKGTFTDFHMKLWGEAIDAEKATKLPMPSDDDDKDHAKVVTTTKIAATTSMTHSAVSHPTEAADHPDRPTKAKSSSVVAVEASPTASAAPSGTQDAQQSPSNANWVSWLPSFGVSEKAQAWIYGALGLIVVFCVGLGAWFFVQRRRNASNTRENYEFELINEEEAEGLNAGEKGAAAGKRRTRGGELYDAFAGGSDDDEDFIPGEYRDQEDPAAGRGRGGAAAGGRRVSSDDGEEQHVIGGDSDDEYDEKTQRRA